MWKLLKEASMKALIAAVCSLHIPGLGQLFYGEVLWAIFWLVAGLLSCGLANILSALHVLFIGDKRNSRSR